LVDFNYSINFSNQKPVVNSAAQVELPKTDSDTTKKNNACKLFAVSALVPSLVYAFYGSQSMKTNADLGIEHSRVKKVINYMYDKNDKLDKLGIQCAFAEPNTKESDFIIKNYGGGAYNFNSKKTLVSKVYSYAVLHELGHAINLETTKLGKVYKGFVHKMYSLPVLNRFSPAMNFGLLSVGLMAGSALCKDKNTKSTDSNSNKFSLSNTIYNNIGKITLGIFSPMLIDEALASGRAYKAAKAVAPEIKTPIIKEFGKAFASYLSIAWCITSINLAVRALVDSKKTDK